MTDATLHDCRVLVIEDEYLLADDLQAALEDAGAIVIGPAADVESGLQLLAGEQSIQAAILDVNLRGETVYPVADALMSRNIPFIFATGYDQDAIPARYGAVPRCEKPVSLRQVVTTIGRSLPG